MKKIYLYIGIALIAVMLKVGYYYYQGIADKNIAQLPVDGAFYIYPNSSYDGVYQKLVNQEILKDPKSFDVIAKLMNYKKDIVPQGRYILNKDMNNRDIIGKFRSGNQDAVNLTFNNARLLEDLSGKLSENILLDSLTILNKLSDPEFTMQHGHSPQTIMSLFIPNTYKVYWDISVSELISRMKTEHNKFWNDKRKAKLEKLGLNETEVYTLASIVDRESLLKSEKPTIAGVYLNRLEKGILLQADPTVVFAVKKFDLKRVLNVHLEYDSPYNTYKYAGLPPGPIGMASITGIDAVLNHEDHDYLYFCAKPESGGAHAFAKSLAGHNRNARIYRNWLSKKGIR